ncbi:MAG TPA: tetratricopeptide repeat protein [Polyangia bacterium]|nr:tetratricopeptide repeat protein [Polyangia bacterium]
MTLALAACAGARPARRADGAGACAAGNATAYHERARQLEQRDPAASARALTCGCALGHAESCYDLAVYEADHGALAGAVAHYEIACRLRHSPACYNLGTCLVSGPCPSDPTRGAQLLRRACDGGVPHACLNLGNSYVLGRGVERRPAEGVALLTRACDAGVALACFNLSVILTNGPVAHDEAAAAQLRDRACRGGIEDACVR